MAKMQSDAAWVTIDPTSMDVEDQQRYVAYKEAYSVMRANRDAFEAGVQQGAPVGKRVICGYNFGKLSMAVVADDGKVASKAKPVQSLAGFLSAQAAGGRA